MTTAERLKTLRRERRISRAELARGIGLSSRVIEYYEHGRIPSTDALCRLADYFQVSTDWLLGRTNTMAVHK